jgi:hypothetical protein
MKRGTVQLVLLSTVFYLVFVVTSPSFAVPTQWTVASGGNDHWYEAIYAPSGITWSDANTAATAMGSGWHLATVTSGAENDFIYNLFGSDSSFSNCPAVCVNSHGPWLGGFATANGSNDWQWVTGEAFSYSNWATFEPYGNGNRIAYFGFHSPLVGPGWNDMPDSHPSTPPLGYIVETSSVPEPSTLLLLGSGLAGLGFVRRRFKG